MQGGMPKFKLYYFDGYGRTEPLRILLGKHNCDYEDVRVGLQDWPGTLKEQLGGTAMPVIEFQDGRKFNQF